MAATVCSTVIASLVTSGPIPSPGSVVILTRINPSLFLPQVNTDNTDKFRSVSSVFIRGLSCCYNSFTAEQRNQILVVNPLLAIRKIGKTSVGHFELCRRDVITQLCITKREGVTS